MIPESGRQEHALPGWQFARRWLAWRRHIAATLFMELSHAHQLILPTDKRNPCFSLYLSEDERFIHVFYGLELFEIVPDDHEHMGFKMMVGRLYNAGVKVTTLEDTFFELKLSGETIRQIIRTTESEKSPASDDIEPPGDSSFDPDIPFLEETSSKAGAPASGGPTNSSTATIYPHRHRPPATSAPTTSTTCAHDSSPSSAAFATHLNGARSASSPSPSTAASTATTSSTKS